MGLKCRLGCTEGYGGLHRRSSDGRLIWLVAREVMAGCTGGYGTEGYDWLHGRLSLVAREPVQR